MSYHNLVIVVYLTSSQPSRLESMASRSAVNEECQATTTNLTNSYGLCVLRFCKLLHINFFMTGIDCYVEGQ